MKKDREREKRERGRETERKSVCVCVSMDLVDWKENRLFNILIMQNLYIVN